MRGKSPNILYKKNVAPRSQTPKTILKIDENGEYYHVHPITGEKHREDGPAYYNKLTGREEWWLNGKRHRTDGPAVKTKTAEAWYKDGMLHREDGPAVEDNEKIEYRIDGYLHREKGPAQIFKGTVGKRIWYYLGRRHREDGPAITFENGNCEYWLENKHTQKEDWEKRTENYQRQYSTPSLDPYW